MSAISESRTQGRQEDKGIVVLGDNATVLGFKLAGVKRAFEARENFKELLEQHMHEKDVSIIIVNEHLLDNLPSRARASAEESIHPIIVPIPDKNMRESDSKTLSALIKRAVGFDLTK